MGKTHTLDTSHIARRRRPQFQLIHTLLSVLLGGPVTRKRAEEARMWWWKASAARRLPRHVPAPVKPSGFGFGFARVSRSGLNVQYKCKLASET